MALQKRLTTASLGKLRDSGRTALTTVVCLILVHYWQWAGAVTYISPTLSVVSGSNLYFGQFCQTFHRVFAANLVGSLIGVAIGLSYQQPSALLVLMFLGLVIVNKPVFTEQLSRVIASLSVVLGSLWPYISPFTGSEALGNLLALILVPFLISGLLLLCPLSLAVHEGQEKARVVLRKLRLAIVQVITSFTHLNEMEFLGSKTDHLLSQSTRILSELALLVSYGESEVFFFCSLAEKIKSLSKLVQFGQLTVVELRGLMLMASQLKENQTQQLFAARMQEPIEGVLDEIDTLFDVFREQFEDDDSGGGKGKGETDKRRPSPRKSVENEGVDLETLMVQVQDGEEHALPHCTAPPGSSSLPLTERYSRCWQRLDEKRTDMVSAYYVTRNKIVWSKRQNPDSDSGDPSPRSKDFAAVEKSIEVEIQRTGFRNLGPRGAFLHRLSVLIDLLGAQESLLFPETRSASSWDSPKEWASRRYAESVAFTQSCTFFQKSEEDEEDRSWSDLVLAVFGPYIQACKISLSICLTALLVVVPWATQPDHGGPDQQTSIWAVAVISLIRQDNTSSSFLMAYQRLEGTGCGVIFSMLLYRLLGDSATVTIPAITIWVALCAFFRSGPRHGYAAVVAAFTPMVLLMSSSTSLERAYDRIQQTFIGIVIYITIENLVWPVKVADAIRARALSLLEESRFLYKHSIAGIKYLMREIDKGRSRSQSSSSATSSPDRRPTTNDVDFEAARASLILAKSYLVSMQKRNKEAAALLALAPHEPVIFARPFPLLHYSTLLCAFVVFCERGDSLLRAVDGLFAAIRAIREESLDAILSHLETFEYMASHMLSMEKQTDDSLSSSYDSLRLLLETGHVGAGWAQLVTLSRSLDKLLLKIDEHFLSRLHSPQGEEVIDVKFLLAWQDVLESFILMVRSFSSIGQALVGVRDVEARG